MRLESVSVGRPRTVRWNGRDVRTSIFKEPVSGPVMVRRHNLDGDRQSDLEVHGGEFKAVYAYAAEDYDWWKTALGGDLEPASFGENLTIHGLDFSGVGIGDIFRMGDAELEAVAPRLPCYKLGIRFGDANMVQRFAQAGRWGIYFRVIREGALAAGSPVERIRTDAAALPAYDVARVRVFDRDDLATIERLAAHEGLDPSWRSHFAGQLAVRT